MNDPEQRWKRLVDAARMTPDHEEPEESVPPGFRERIHGLRDVVAAFAKALLWRRWSVVLAICCLALFLAVLAVTRCNAPGDPLILPPEFKSLSSYNNL